MRARDAAADWLVAGVDLSRAVARRLAPGGRRGAAQNPQPGCEDIPVVIIPGILEPWTYLAPMSRWFTDRGHPVHHVETLGWNLRSIDASAQRCLDMLRDRGVTRAVIVAHSKGGLIGKAVLMRAAAPRGSQARTSGKRKEESPAHTPGTREEESRLPDELRESEGGTLPDTVLGMVTVATPFAGSTLGGPLQRLPLLGRSPLGMFLPGSPQIRTLMQERQVNAHIVSLAPKWDQVIPGGSHLDGATNVTLDVPGHFRPVRDEHVWETIHEFVHTLAEASR